MLPNERVDERDTMFARRERILDTEPYQDYYSRHPELKTIDDRIRRLHPLFHPAGQYYHSKITKQAKQYFDSIETIIPDSEIIDNYASQLKKSSMSTHAIKRLIYALGAVGVGYSILQKEFIYTHRGRLNENYGQAIELDHPNVIVFLVEMNFDNMQKAPHAETLFESGKQYYRAAEISLTLAAILQTLGFSAKAHYDAHYDIMLPPLAVQAGLGELGRNNILIADKYGSRVRIGAITTDLPLDFDKPIDLGADHFCDNCKKCADNCPSNALSIDKKENIHGIEKWPTNIERCYSIWLKYGTDCGICMACCPYSHHNNWFHNMTRWMVRSFPSLHRIFLYLDDLVYGRKWQNQ